MLCAGYVRGARRLARAIVSGAWVRFVLVCRRVVAVFMCSSLPAGSVLECVSECMRRGSRPSSTAYAGSTELKTIRNEQQLALVISAGPV